MDNLTHSLVGSVLGQMGLKRQTGLAMPTLIIAANLPDIDAVATVLGTRSLALRRGITHGPIALIVLPLVLAVLMVALDRWQLSRKRRPAARLPVKPLPLLGLAYIGVLSHPLLDWLNSYGIRLLEPFSSEWFAANTLFIIDVWLWAALIVGVAWSVRREKRGHAAWRTPAVACVAAMVVYVAANGLISHRAETLTHAHVHGSQGHAATLVVANPVPLMFWQREMLWRDTLRYGEGSYSLLGAAGGLQMSPNVKQHHMGDPRVAAVAASQADVRAFLFWSRMPFASFDQGYVTLGDQRFTRDITRSTFTVKAPWTGTP